MSKSTAFGQIACRYQILAEIRAPTCGPQVPPTVGTRISPNGRFVCGYYCPCACFTTRSFLYDIWAHAFLTLNPPGIPNSVASDVTDEGVVVGFGETSTGTRGYVYALSSGQYTLLSTPIPSGSVCIANSINASNVVCGTRTIGGAPDYPRNAFIWSASVFTDLGVMTGSNSQAMDITDFGTVVGWTGGNVISAGTRPFVHEGGMTHVLALAPGAAASAAVGISDDGYIAIQAQVPHPGGSPNLARGFVYHDGEYIDLGTMPGFEITILHGVGRGGVCAGIVRSLSRGDRSFVWASGELRDLSGLVGRDGLFVAFAGPVSPNGLILGTANDQEGAMTLVLSPVHVAGDAQPDCRVDVDDLLAVITDWGASMSPADVNGDESVDVDDLIVVLVNWTF